jgi:hypothetical protein
VLATCSWWALVLIGRWFEPGESFLMAWFLFVPLGPVLSAVIVTAPRFRGTDEGACDGGGDHFAVRGPRNGGWLVGFRSTLASHFTLVMVLVGVVSGWGVSEMVALSQEPEGKSEDDQGPRSPL